MPDSRAENLLVPRWLHGWAVFTAAATVALLALGATVTTFRVGMADVLWPTTPWHLFVYYEPSAGYVIEHSHRIAGWLVGFCTIVLAIGLWRTAPRRVLGWLGLTALLAVGLQGVLGGLRVRLNELVGTDLAYVHGTFAQVVFSLLVSLAVLTSRKPLAPLEGTDEEIRRLRRLALLLVALVFLQLVWGALLRHTYRPLAQRGHLLTAFAVVAVAIVLIQRVWGNPSFRRRLGRVVVLLGIFLILQLLLGVEAWLKRFTAGTLPEMQRVTIPHAVIWTGHVLVGSWILAASVVAALQAWRKAPAPVPIAVSPVGRAAPLFRPTAPAAPAHSLEAAP
jgi:heme A synthase